MTRRTCTLGACLALLASAAGVASARTGAATDDGHRIAAAGSGESPLTGAAPRGKPPDRTVTLGAAVRVGSGALPAGDDTRWRILRAPQGSEARLSGAGDARPRLAPDVPGPYRIGLVPGARVPAQRGSGPPAAAATSARETIVVDAAEANPLVPVKAGVTEGDRFGIEVGGEFVAGPGGVPVQAFAFDRRTLELPPLAVGGFNDMGAIAGWIDQQLNTYGTPLIVIQTTSLGQVTAGGRDQFNAVIEKVGGTAGDWAWAPGMDAPPVPFTVIGVPGMASGEGHQIRAGAPLSGYFVLSANAYTFAWGDYVPFETKPADTDNGTSNVITIGDQEIEAPEPANGWCEPGDSTCVYGGFQVATFDRYDLSPISNETMETGSDNGATARPGLLEMHGRLNGSTIPHQDRLAVIASLGQTVDPRYRDYLTYPAVMDDFHRLGGTGEVLGRLGASDTYSLVGASGQMNRPQEASSIIHPPGEPHEPDEVTGRIEGVFERNHLGLYEPKLASPEEPDFSMSEIAFGPSSAWPHSDAPDYAAASRWFANEWFPEQGIDDVRDAYDRTTLVANGWSSLETPPYPRRASFSRATYDALVSDYKRTGVGDPNAEFAAVDRILNFMVGPNATIKEPFTASALLDYAELQEIANQIHLSAELPPQDSGVRFDIFEIISELLWTGTLSGLESERAMVMFTLLAALTGTADGISVDQGGSPASRIETSADRLAVELEEGVNRMLRSFDTIAQIAVHDHDKLIATSELIKRLPWTIETPDVLGEQIHLGARRSFYNALMPVAWNFRADLCCNGAFTYFGAPSTTPGDPHALCGENFETDYDPLANMPDSAGYQALAGWDSSNVPLYRQWFWGIGPPNIGNALCEDDDPLPAENFAPAYLTNVLFAPAGARVPETDIRGAGLYAPWFLRRNFTAWCFRVDPCSGEGPRGDFLFRAPVWGEPACLQIPCPSAPADLGRSAAAPSSARRR